MLKIIGLLTIGIFGWTGVGVAQGVVPDARQGPPVIVTSGEGTVRMAPDRAWVTIAAESRDRSPEAAQLANTTAMTAVIAKIKAGGVSADAIQTSGYTLEPEFDYANGRQSLRDYVARNQVEVRVDSLAKLGDILAAAVGTGATNVSGVRFDLKDRAAAERQALTAAVHDARARADAIAAGAGVQIERILRIEEDRQPTVVRPMGFTPMRAMAAPQAPPPVPIESGEMDIEAHVTLTAAIR